MTATPLPYASRVGDGRSAEGLPSHAGTVPKEPYDFFAAPPDGLGELVSAESTLRVGREPWPTVVWVCIAATMGTAVFGLFFLFVSVQTRPPDQQTVMLFGAVLAVATFVLTVLYTQNRQRTCTYVGTDGVARLAVRGRRDGLPKIKQLSFADAAELRASQVRHHVNGVYTGTNYDYRWTDANGRQLLRLSGSYRAGKKKRPRPGSPFHFARAAEVAWSNHFLARAHHSLQTEGAIPFRVDKNRWLRIGPGFMEFHFGGDPARVERADIAKVTLGNGTFAFQHVDAKWFSRSGKYAFQYGAMGNAQVFLFALDKLMGYRWG